MKRSPNNAGFSMVEVAMALGVVSVAFVSIVSMLPLGLNDTRNSVAGTEASCVMAAIAADLLAAPVSGTNSARYQIKLPTAADVAAGSQRVIYTADTGSNRDSSGAILSGANAKYKATINFQPRPASQNTSIPVQIGISWPAAASGPGASSLETVISLNR